MDISIYDTLLGLPLFQGLSKLEFGEVLEKVCFDFSGAQDGETFITSCSLCSHFVFILNGKALSRRSTADGRLTFIEELEAPSLLEPYSMFGMQPVFSKDYVASGNVGILRIDKQYLYSELYKYSICRMNLLNILSGRIQNLESDLWNMRQTTIRERIVNMVSSLSDSANGQKEVKVRMEDFAAILGETRLNVSKTLNSLENEGLIVLKRGGFVVPSLERLTTKLDYE